ncbi:MAG: SDR family oxidoreductase, partial [Candidatus Omnitrophica bacterium]|nr:SDR family oxidoreductase [Candidatus Omnitrophota bacterium]
MKHIFITGATGFLGWDIVKNLIEEDEHSNLYLLVRGDSEQAAIDRVRKLIRKSYESDRIKKINERIEVIKGDIAERGLGISRFQLDRLHKKIDTIYHCAALCDFEVPLRPIRRINVFGTKNVLDLALRCKE